MDNLQLIYLQAILHEQKKIQCVDKQQKNNKNGVFTHSSKVKRKIN